MQIASITRSACLAAACFVLAPWFGACGEGLGPCDDDAARELVYSKQGALVATKGQALMHDSCGQGVFCHSANAKGDARLGAPIGMDYDMLPLPSGWPRLIQDRDAVWYSVLVGKMPPENLGHASAARTEWIADSQLRKDAPRLASLATEQGKAALRNWLACGAPLVAATHVPDWARPVSDDDGGASGQLDWSQLYADLMKPACATAGCHDAAAAGRLAMVDECGAYRQLLAVGPCGQARLTPGDASSSLLTKMESRSQKCGTAMPPAGILPSAELARVRQWVLAGAAAHNCQ